MPSHAVNERVDRKKNAMQWWHIAILLFAGSLLLIALAILVFVTYRALALICAIDAQVLRELIYRPVSRLGVDGSNSIINRFNAAQQTPTDGDYVVNTDEEFAVQEQLRNLKERGLGYLDPEDEKELAARIRQGGVSDSV